MLNKNEVLRYLGYRGQSLDNHINSIIDDCLAEIVAISDPRHVAKTFDICRDNQQIFLESQSVQLQGKAIASHLDNSQSCIVLAATLGVNVDRKIRRLQYHDLTRATILDACATTYIEAYCDQISAELSKEASHQGQYLTTRFSPGYGDLPLTIQKSLLAVLDTGRKIGLTVNEHHLLIPRKSVTAIVGVQSINTSGQSRSICKNCSVCTNNACHFKKT